MKKVLLNIVIVCKNKKKIVKDKNDQLSLKIKVERITVYKKPLNFQNAHNQLSCIIFQKPFSTQPQIIRKLFFQNLLYKITSFCYGKTFLKMSNNFRVHFQ